MNKSLWQDTCTLPQFPSLEKDISTDVLIIGGGMAGLLCAFFLDQENTDYVLVEAAEIGSGTTGKTTAVLSAQHGLLYDSLINKFGLKTAKQYLDANLAALEDYKSLSQYIDCDYEERPSYVYSRTKVEELEKEVIALSKLGFNAKLEKSIQLPMEIAAAVKFGGQAQFHPLKFIDSIAQKLKIYEHTRIERTDGTTAYTANNKIIAKKIIVCSHFPIINTNGLFFAKLHQTRSYVIALENAAQYDGTYTEDTESGIYLRNYNDLLIVGGGDQRTGGKKDGFKIVRDFAATYYPDATEKYAWATQDCMSLDSIPYIGRYAQNLPNVYVASGFNEWGMTSSMVSARIITDMIAGRENKFAEAFDPSRSMLHPQLFNNLGTTLINFVTPSAKRCPHLGCALKWNKFEHTWDCPCHGSRFEKDGKLINDPATGDLDVS